MRIALVIEDGREQIVLTPETKHESALLEKMHQPGKVAQFYKGEYYHCQGGWTRQGGGEQSTILVLNYAE